MNSLFLTDNFFTSSGTVRLLEYLANTQMYPCASVQLWLNGNLIDLFELSQFMSNESLTVCFCDCSNSSACPRGNPSSRVTLHLPGILRQRFSCSEYQTYDDVMHVARRGIIGKYISNMKSVDSLLGIMRAVVSTGNCQHHEDSRDYSAEMRVAERAHILNSRVPMIREARLIVTPAYLGSCKGLMPRCGLDLRVVDDGYRVVRAIASYNQSGIHAGDTIVSIGGIRLAGLDSDEMRNIFLSRMIHGAIVTIHSNQMETTPMSRLRKVQRIVSIKSLIGGAGNYMFYFLLF